MCQVNLETQRSNSHTWTITVQSLVKKTLKFSFLHCFSRQTPAWPSGESIKALSDSMIGILIGSMKYYILILLQQNLIQR